MIRPQTKPPGNMPYPAPCIDSPAVEAFLALLVGRDVASARAQVAQLDAEEARELCEVAATLAALCAWRVGRADA